MKRRNRSGRRRSKSPFIRPFGMFSQAKRKRKTYSFEQLEDRFAFAVATTEMVVNSYSNDTAEGQLATWLSEMQWAARSAAAAAGLGHTPQYQFLSLPSDPMFPRQWHLFNNGQVVGQDDLQNLFGVAGQDINVLPVWQGEGLERPYTGEGVLVAVVDSGVQLFHPDLIANIHPTLRLNATNGTTNVTPDLLDSESFHGTAVAGLIAAAWNNLSPDGNGLEGGTGVAPDATIVPIKVDSFSGIELQRFLEFVLQNNIHITNNSWGPVHTTNRGAFPFAFDPVTGLPDPALSAQIVQLLRDTAVSGRNGLGTIHVFAAGNEAGPSFHTGWNPLGNYDSSSYNAWVNSRYTIGVTGVDHDGLYINADGTFTSYPTAGPSVLVAAPTGSSGLLTVGDDDGFGSGIWTTDLIGDFGRNADPLPSGFDPDRDLWDDIDYTSRMNGTSASAALVSGVIALMLEAEPNLSYRDVQEILVRSARQNAQFEFPSTGAGGSLSTHLPPQNTWQVNQIGSFRNPDTWIRNSGQDPFISIADPFAVPYDYVFPGSTLGGSLFAPDTLDGNRQGSSYYEPQPALFTNGAGFTVSQGYGVYGEQIGYGHGVIDAALAVQMAERWFDLEHDTATRLSEKTFTTSIVSPGQGFFWSLPAAQKTTGPPDGPAMVVPGGIFGIEGWIEYWNQYFVDDDPANLDDGPFADYDGLPPEARGDSYVDFAVPPDQAMSVEWVEVKLELSGDPSNLDFLRIMLTSPEGTQSELNNYYLDPALDNPYSFQPTSPPPDRNDPLGTIQETGDGNFVWTFSTNRHWGESSNSVPILHPVTGEPLLDGNGLPIFRNWELHFENWSDGAFEVLGMEVIWHGKEISGGTVDPNYGAFGIGNAQRVQGFVGLDTNADGDFNYNRYVQTLFGTHSDVSTIRSTDVFRQLDFNDNNFNGVFDTGDTINQEPFVENITVQAFRVFDGVAEAQPIAEFLTGHDGNYYFDFNVQADQAYANSIGATNFEYEIRVVDPEGRVQLDDFATRNMPVSPNAPPGTRYLEHYRDVWRISPDWFFAPDRDNNPVLLSNEPGEILFDPVTGTPVPFSASPLGAVPMAVKNINFLLKQDAPANEVVINGTVYADLNGDGIFNGDDAVQPGAFVYWDINRDGESAGDPRVVTDANGRYTITVPVTQAGTFQFGVIRPPGDWEFTDPGGDGLESVFIQPGSQPQVINFFLEPIEAPGGGQLGNIIGIIFNDLNEDGIRNPGEGGIGGVTVFIDADENGIWDSATEQATVTAANGSYSFANLQPGLIRIDVHIPNEDTPNAAWDITTPLIGYREVQLVAGSTVTDVTFGLENRADRDWGDLPNSFNTTSTANPVGPSHLVVQGFRLGSNIDGEVNGLPSANADGDDNIGGADDGVRIVSNGGILQPGLNLVEVAVLGFGGVLTGWIDWNNSGTFDESERIIWRDANGNVLGGEADLVQGSFTLQFIAPANIADGMLGARFRWGEPGLSFTGPAMIGEVEDYILTATSSPLSNIPGDYNNDSQVDVADFIIWRKFLGTNVYLPNDSTPGTVTQADYDVWKANVGATLGGGSSQTDSGGSGSEQAAVVADAAAPSVRTDELILALPAAQTAPTGVSSSIVVAAASPSQLSDIAADMQAGADVDVAASSSLLAVDLALAGNKAVSFDGTTGATPSVIAAAASNSVDNLLLLDQALADLDAESDDDPITDRFHRNEDAIDDVELAAAFADESTNWWGV